MAKDGLSRPIWLLLLPDPPSDLSLSALRVAYGPGLTLAMKNASNVSAGGSTLILDIAMAYEDDLAFDYWRLQSLFGLMYRLICVICSEESIDRQYENDVDARLALVRSQQNKGQSSSNTLQMSVIDIQTLAATKREWQRICSLEGESAEGLLRDFLQQRNKLSRNTVPAAQVERLPGGLIIRQSQPKDSVSPVRMFHRYNSVAVGGTFDHLHAGHKLLLTMTALVLEPEIRAGGCLTIGITGDELLKKKKYRKELESFFERQSAVQYFLLGILELISPFHVLENTQQVSSSEPFGREVHDTLKSGLIIKYVEIFDPCGPTITDASITALVLSAETRSGGRVVNEKRGEKGWRALEVFEVDVLDAGERETGQADDEFQSKISSTDIRHRLHQKTAIANGIF